MEEKKKNWKKSALIFASGVVTAVGLAVIFNNRDKIQAGIKSRIGRCKTESDVPVMATQPQPEVVEPTETKVEKPSDGYYKPRYEQKYRNNNN